MVPVDSHDYISLLSGHPYVAATVLFTASCSCGVYRLIALVCRLRYGYLVAQQDADRAAEIIDATLRRPRRPCRRPQKRD